MIQNFRQFGAGQQTRGFVPTVMESAFCLYPDFRDVLFSITKKLLNVGFQSKG